MEVCVDEALHTPSLLPRTPPINIWNECRRSEEKFSPFYLFPYMRWMALYFFIFFPWHNLDIDTDWRSISREEGVKFVEWLWVIWESYFLVEGLVNKKFFYHLCISQKKKLRDYRTIKIILPLKLVKNITRNNL